MIESEKEKLSKLLFVIKGFELMDNPVEKPNVKDVKELSIKEYRGQRVVTFKDIDEVHGRPEGTANRNFKAHKERLIDGEDYYFVQGDEIRHLGLKSNFGAYLFTESGYLMLVKSFTDDLAWEAQRKLVKNYFRVKTEISKNIVVDQYMMMSEEDRAIAYFQAIKAKKEQERVAIEAEIKIKALEPKAQMASDLIESEETLVSMKEMADLLGIQGFGRTRLFEFLREEKIIQQKPNRLPYRQFIERGYFEVKEKPRPHNPDIYDPVTLITPKGQEYIYNLVHSKNKKEQTFIGKVKNLFKKTPLLPTTDTKEI